MNTQDKTHDSGEAIPTSIRLTLAERAALRKIADSRHRSVTAQIRAWIDEFSRDDSEAAA